MGRCHTSIFTNYGILGPESSLFANHGMLGVLFSRMLPVRKLRHFEYTLFPSMLLVQYTISLVASWKKCRPPRGSNTDKTRVQLCSESWRTKWILPKRGALHHLEFYEVP